MRLFPPTLHKCKSTLGFLKPTALERSKSQARETDTPTLAPPRPHTFSQEPLCFPEEFLILRCSIPHDLDSIGQTIHSAGERRKSPPCARPIGRSPLLSRTPKGPGSCIFSETFFNPLGSKGGESGGLGSAKGAKKRGLPSNLGWILVRTDANKG